MDEPATTPAPATSATSAGNGFIQRELNGASFLTLEHTAHMALAVIVPALVAVGLISALSLWFGTGGITSAFMGGMLGMSGGGAKAIEAALALGVVAALLVLVPLFVILDRRTRAEWHKRPGYAGRLAYKVPVYSALAVLGMLKVVAFIEMLYVVIASLAFVGIASAPISTMYMDTFLPAAISFVAYALSAWYIFKLAKGQDNGRMFSMVNAGLAGAVVVALLITSIVALHSATSGGDSSPQFTSPSSNTYDSQYYQDLLNKYQ